MTRHTINGYVLEMLLDRRVAQYLVDLAGILRVQIMSLALNGR